MKLIMIGDSKYAQMLKEYIEDDNDEIVSYVVDKEYMTSDFIKDIPVTSFEQLKELYPSDEYKLVLGIGYSRLGELRKHIYDKCKEMGYDFYTYIHPTAVIDKSVKMGEGNIVFENVVIQKGAMIGVGNLFFSNAVIMHDNMIGNHSTFGACSVANGYVRVEDCCFIGANSTIRDGITIKRNSLIGAGTYVNKSTEEGMGALPAKTFYNKGGSITLSENL